MKSLLPLLFALLSLQTISAQRETYFETGFLLGLTNYSGDLAESSIELSENPTWLRPLFPLPLFQNTFRPKRTIYSALFPAMMPILPL